ncbi:AtzH-like domain-containing protein [Demequina aurantiaca]|uniref:AtzH-like domain-containing protein n=1 Tax=Demequina aurantiaca TaxID=676200 RepID=UPI003D35889F
MREYQASVPDGELMPAQLIDALMGYEAALASDDVELLGAYFVDGDEAMRADAAGLLVGRDQIDRFRGGRGGAPARVLGDIQVRPVGADHAYVTSVTAPAKGGRGLVTQLWRQTISGATPGGWVIVAAHVSAPPAALDARIWRVVGNPLVAPSVEHGPLSGHTVAVKDVFAVPGFAIGGGVPAYLAQSRVEDAPADALAALLDAGASVAGIAQTDQFAYSIAGVNGAYGTPPNVAAPGSIPGGSSSGPAAAVASGHASIGLGTDTAGSIRVPASYQGLWGLRPTHGAVSLRGALPLAPAYDTPGLLTRDGETLLAAARAMLPAGTQRAVGLRDIAVSSALFEAADQDVHLHLLSVIDAMMGGDVFDVPRRVSVPTTAELFRIFRYTQSPAAARSWSAWIDAHPGALADDVAARFAWAATVTSEQEAEALEAKAAAREALDAALGDSILVLPSASSAAPALDASPERLNSVREATLGITAVAGITGRPALSVPVLQTDDGPVGLCLVGPRGSELALIETALAWMSA